MVKRKRVPRSRPSTTSKATPDVGDRRALRPAGPRFLPQSLDRTVIVIPLLRALDDPRGESVLYDVIIVPNADYSVGFDAACSWILTQLQHITERRQRYTIAERRPADRYVFAKLDAVAIRELARRSRESLRGATSPATPLSEPVASIWPDFQLRAFAERRSKRTASKTNASHRLGADITWAVIDSGIDAGHSHFRTYQSLRLPAPLAHMDFTGGNPLLDPFGHGTHLAGIIAGEIRAADATGERQRPRAVVRERDEYGNPVEVTKGLGHIAGAAPQCKLLSLKVLDDTGTGRLSSVLSAIAYVQQINSQGNSLKIQGVILSVGYETEPDWQAAGPSPLRVEINRLVSTGTVVVVADGDPMRGDYSSYVGNCEPGNAEGAISVASTLVGTGSDSGGRMFSPKKVHLDENDKPDIIAPVGRIISSGSRSNPTGKVDEYVETSGTSLVAARVSGAIAAFLSVKKEFIGKPDAVKKLFTSSEGIKLLNSGLTEQMLQELGKQNQRTKVFISYSHRDKKWLDRLHVHLKPLEREGIFDLWDDSRIRTGDKWKEKISEALKTARVAVLLISADFLNSDFIQNDELPTLLAGAESEGVVIMSIIIKPSLYKRVAGISQFQAVNPPEKPLIALSEKERESYWLKLAEDIARVLEEHPTRLES